MVKKKLETFQVKTKQINFSRFKEALITTLFALGGIYATFLTLIFIENSDAVNNLYQAQSELGALFVNLFAVVGVSYSKFSREIFLHKNIYWLTLTSFFVIISIFAQARIMTDVNISSIFNWVESPSISIILQIILGLLIFIISIQKELEVRINFKKKKLN